MNSSILLSTFSLVIFLHLAKATNFTLPDDENYFYWREYQGQIPRDAIDVGLDAAGHKLYIGCAVAKSEHNSYGVYPGSIIGGREYIQISVDHTVQSRQEAVWILCSNSPNKLHWSKRTTWTFNEAFTSSTSPVKGGLQMDNINSYPIYIGRYHTDYGFQVGKIVTSEGENERPLYYIASSGGESKANEYEALILQHV